MLVLLLKESAWRLARERKVQRRGKLPNGKWARISDKWKTSIRLERRTAYNQRGTPGTRIFSPLTVPRLCVPIGHYWYLFKRLTAVFGARFYRFEHIVSYSSSKVRPIPSRNCTPES